MSVVPFTLRIAPAPREAPVCGADRNSLVSGDLTGPEFRTDAAGNTRHLDRAVDGAGGAAILLNGGGNAQGAAGSIYQTAFVVPAGVTSAVLSVGASSSTGSTSVMLTLTNAGLSNILASQRFTLQTGTPQLLQLPLAPLTPGTTYGVAIVVNDIGQQARPLVWSFAVTPSGAASGIFAAEFVRIGNMAGHMGATTLGAPWFQMWAPIHSRYAEVNVETDAATIAAECYSNDSYTAIDYPQTIGYLANGRPLAQSAGFPLGMGIVETSLPGNGDTRRITVRTHGKSISGIGCYLRALYLPLSARARFVVSSQAPRILVVGDSIALGVGSDNPQWQAWPMALRHCYPGSVLVDAGSGRQLYENAADPGALGFALSKASPTHVWIAGLGTNDFGVAPWNAADFGAAYATMLDELRAGAPHATITCQTPTRRSDSEAANAKGSTLLDYCAQIQAVATAAARVRYCRFVDGRAAPFPQTQGPDHVHMDTLGHGVYFDAVAANLIATGVL